MRVLLVLTSVAVVTALAGVMGLVAVRDGVADELRGSLPGSLLGPTGNATGTPTASTGPCLPPTSSPDGESSQPCVPVASPVPSPAWTVAYSHSWYVDNPDDMTRLGTSDAQWLNYEVTHAQGSAAQSFPSASATTTPGTTPGTTSGTTSSVQSATSASCAQDFLTVLDFGHPTRKFKGNVSALDDYAMTLFGVRTAWRTYREVEQLAEHYLDAWVAAASHCVQLHLVLGTSNFAQCRDAVVACDIATGGQYWDVVVHDVMDYVAAKGYGSQVVAVWVGDDLETSWDPWTASERFLTGVAQQESTYATHAQLLDYGDADTAACSVVTRSCKRTWTAANIYAAAWGIGWDIPLPEAYNSTALQHWLDVADSEGSQIPLTIAGVMTECAGSDPLPSGLCHPQRQTEAGPVAGTGACEWSPTLATTQAHASDAGRSLAYVTNIQWADPPAGDQTGSAGCT